MNVTCNTCGAENPSDAPFCEECGIDLTASDSASPPDSPAPEAVAEQPATELISPPDSLSDDDFDFPEDFPLEEEPLGEEPLEETPLEPAAEVPSATPSAAPTSGMSAESPSSIQNAQLVLIEFGNPTDKAIPLTASPLVVGKFDPSLGPIEIDLGTLPGNEYLSRRHAELSFDAGWTVRDLGSTNGVFIRKQGQENFQPRLQSPTKLDDGDEIAFGNMRFMFREGSG